VLLLEERGGILFSSDHILERITPNPTIHLEPYRGRRSGLGHYVASLARLRDLPVARVEPGHGAGFGGLAARIDEILRHHEERKRKIVGILAERGPRTVLEIALELWPDLPPYEHYMGSREVLGHLDLLIEANAVREEVGSRGAALFLTRT
jgi:glyoxylase-like metal-dependent hydrolase (beta-lactamase superfamily II)